MTVELWQLHMHDSKHVFAQGKTNAGRLVTESSQVHNSTALAIGFCIVIKSISLRFRTNNDDASAGVAIVTSCHWTPRWTSNVTWASSSGRQNFQVCTPSIMNSTGVTFPRTVGWRAPRRDAHSFRSCRKRRGRWRGRHRAADMVEAPDDDSTSRSDAVRFQPDEISAAAHIGDWCHARDAASTWCCLDDVFVACDL